jgi:hypothetical protein
MDNYQYSGIVVCDYGGKSFLCKHLDSSDTVFINLDAECKDVLGGDSAVPKTKMANNLSFYRKAQEILQDVQEIHSKTSKQIQKIAFITRYYRLLKYLAIPTISYTCPTQLYFDNLKLGIGDLDAIKDYKEILQKNKGDKLKTYSSTDELLKLVCDLYQCKAKI